MSVSSEIARLGNAKQSIKTAIEEKGVSVPENEKIDNYSDYISAIRTGGNINWLATAARGQPPEVLNAGTAIGYGARAKENYSIAVGTGAKAIGAKTTVFGDNAEGGIQEYNIESTAIGYNAKAGGSYATVLGSESYADGYNATAVGYYAEAYKESATAIGAETSAGGVFSIAIGKNALVYENCNGSTAIGYQTDIRSPYSIALGAYSRVMGENSTAIGYNVIVPTSNTIFLGNSDIESIQAAVTTITALSDQRTKEDIQYANTAQCLADIERVPVRRFKYKKFARYAPKDVHITEFIAQEVAEVFPKSIHIYDEEFPVLDDDGNPVMITELDKNGNVVYENDGVTERKVKKKFKMKNVMHMDKNFAIPTMWAAIQELSNRVKELSSRISYLENNQNTD